MPVTAHPEFLGQSSAYTTLENARQALATVPEQELTLAVTDLTRWSERYDSHEER
ncbi:hypothetical protein ACQPW1_22715 [Nocardia sp. CA-128927]|uniref:hypothetical protein n=1 Tax=Nocardia sp. CA-128927 TaxID=3239975 RepID=UPI003D957A38